MTISIKSYIILGSIRTMNEVMFTSQHGNRVHCPKVAIMITAGDSDKDRHLTVPEAKKAKDNNTFIITVGVGIKVKSLTLKPQEKSPLMNQIYQLYIIISQRYFL